MADAGISKKTARKRYKNGMANNKRLTEVGKATQFSSDNQPENRGRKPSVLRYIKDGGVSLADIRRMMGSFIFDHTTKEIADLLKDKENPPPVGVSIILGSLSEDLQNKNLANFEKLMDRAYGKPIQGFDVTTSGSMEIISITPAERQKRIKELLAKAKRGDKKAKNEPGRSDGK
jgi:hypothetical protein